MSTIVDPSFRSSPQLQSGARTRYTCITISNSHQTLIPTRQANHTSMPPPAVTLQSAPSFSLRPKSVPPSPSGKVLGDASGVSTRPTTRCTPCPSDSDPEPSAPAVRLATPKQCKPPGLITPPPSTERHRQVSLPTLFLRSQFGAPPPFISPSRPPLMQDLTPDMLSALSRSGMEIRIRCEVHKLLQWKEQNHLYLEDLWGMWEYDSESFIIKCMPTPMHESFTGYAYEQIISTIRAVTGKSASMSGVQVLTNSNVTIPDPFKYTTIIPDLSTKVRLHPPQPQRYRQSVIFEVGFSQTLLSLRERAHKWLYEVNPEQVHLVILVDLHEIQQPYIDSRTGEAVPKSRAQKRVFEWPVDCFGGRGFAEEVRRRSIGPNGEPDEAQPGSTGEDGTGEDGTMAIDIGVILMDLKNEVKRWLLEEDEKEKLIPALIEPIDGHIYVYRRLGEHGEKYGVQALHTDYNNRTGREGTVVAQEGQQQQGEDVGRQEVRIVQKVQAEVIEGSESKADDDSDDSSDCNSQEWPHSSSASSSSPVASTSPSTDNSLGLELSFSAKFISSSTLTPPSTGSPSHFCLSIAELFGPLPIPTTTNQNITIPAALLAEMPPHLRAHAGSKIMFDLHDIASLLMEHAEEMKDERAVKRASGVVDRAYKSWWGVVQAAKQRQEALEIMQREVEEKGRRRSERAERNKRKAGNSAEGTGGDGEDKDLWRRRGNAKFRRENGKADE